MSKKKEDKVNNLFRTIIILFVYLLYTPIFTSIALVFNFTDTVIINFIADVCFLAFIIFIYRDKLKSDINTYHDNSLKKRFLKIISWVLIIFIANIVGSFISTLISDTNLTSNNIAILSLPYIYTFFKTLIFSSIGEELVFKQSIRDIVDNNIIFLIISSLIYSVMNIAYTSLTGLSLIANMIPYLVFAITTGILYIKNKDNIYIVIIIKLVYNLIPLIVMLGGVG